MLLSIKKTTQILKMKHHCVYYLVTMGEVEAIKVGGRWRLTPESVADYDKRFPERKNKKPAGDFIHPGNGEFLFDGPPICLQPYQHRETYSMERRRGKLVHSPKRPDKVLLAKFKPVTQLELFPA